MASNPFDAGAGPASEDYPTVSLGTVLTSGSAVALRHMPHFLGASLMLFLAYIVSLMMLCIGILFTAPLMMWGMYRFILSVADGEADFAELWSAADDPGRIFLQGWGLILLLMVVMSPAMAAAVAGQLAAEQDVVPPWLGAAAPSVVGGVWAAIVAPLMYTPLVWADTAASPTEALRRSLDGMKGSWGAVAALAVITQVLMLPNTVFGVYIEERTAALEAAPPEVVLGLAGEVMAATAGLYLVLFVVGWLSTMWSATAYRQVFPRPSQSRG